MWVYWVGVYCWHCEILTLCSIMFVLIWDSVQDWTLNIRPPFMLADNTWSSLNYPRWHIFILNPLLKCQAVVWWIPWDMAFLYKHTWLAGGTFQVWSKKSHSQWEPLSVSSRHNHIIAFNWVLGHIIWMCTSFLSAFCPPLGQACERHNRLHWLEPTFGNGTCFTCTFIIHATFYACPSTFSS